MCLISIEMVKCKHCGGVYGSYRDRTEECGLVGTALCKETVAEKKEVPGDECCGPTCERDYAAAQRAKRYQETGKWPGVSMKSGNNDQRRNTK